MPRPHALEIYRSFRFSLTVPGLEAPRGLTAVWSDVFEPGRLWLGSAHAVDRASLIEVLRARVADGVRSPGVVSLFNSDHTRSKEIPFTFGGIAAELPFDLDAMREDTALEWVVLEGVRYGVPVDREWARR